MRQPRIDLYKDSAGKWRWRYVANNGRILADSGQGYRNKSGAIHCLESVTGGTYRDTFTYGPELDRTPHGQLIEVRVQP